MVPPPAATAPGSSAQVRFDTTQSPNGTPIVTASPATARNRAAQAQPPRACPHAEAGASDSIRGQVQDPGFQNRRNRIGNTHNGQPTAMAPTTSKRVLNRIQNASVNTRTWNSTGTVKLATASTKTIAVAIPHSVRPIGNRTAPRNRSPRSPGSDSRCAA